MIELTYEDGEHLKRLRGMTEAPELVEVLDRIIDICPARPPLPTGWVLYSGEGVSSRVLWHDDGALYISDDNTGFWGLAAHFPDTISPLRVLDDKRHPRTPSPVEGQTERTKP